MHLSVRVAAFIAIANATLPQAARAESHLNCDAYASSAIAQQTSNKELGCGFDGGGWSFDYLGHRNWCLISTTTMANLTAEDGRRAQALAACRTRAQACDSYASVALIQNKFNQAASCGLSGGRWSSDQAGHRAWCMAVTPNQSLAETDARSQALGLCQSGMDEAEIQKLQNQQQQAENLLNSIIQSSGGNDVLKDLGG